jgi:anaerobic magnesium-protoporphyrin IX monomethyl ester cyclase
MTEKISRILFVEPPRQYWFLMGEYLPPPTGLLALAAYVEREIPDIEIDIMDCQAEGKDWKGLEKRLESSAPSIVATSGFTTNAYSCVRTAEIAKKVDNDIINVVGGSHFSFIPEESLTSFPEIDYIVRGEGEVTLVDLIRTLSNGGDVGRVKGISFRHGREIMNTPPRPLIEDLDSLPYPAYHLIEKNIPKYHFSMMAGKNTRYMILEGSRGCSHSCSFCTQWRHWGGTCRTKSSKRIADEIELLNEKYGGVFLWLTDDNFGYGARAEGLYEELRHRSCKDDIMFFFQARTDDVVANPESVAKLREVGNYWVLLGVENDSDERLKEFRKGIRSDQAREAIRLLNKNEIFSQAMFVIGSRKDTHESIERLRRFSLDLGADISIFAVLTPFPGTEFYDSARSSGWIEDNNYAHYDMVHAIMPTETLTRAEVQKELYECYRNFYGSYAKGIAGVFSKNKLKRIAYRHLASQMVLSKMRRLV